MNLNSLGASSFRYSASLVREMLVLLVAVLAGTGAVAQEERVPRRPARADAMAVIQSARYAARLEENDLVEGTVSLEVTKRGEGTSMLDWSEVTVPISDLSANDRAAIWGTVISRNGTEPDARRVVVIDTPDTRLQGGWSARGEEVEERLLFDLNLPPALHSTLTIELPQGWSLSSTHGLVAGPPQTRSAEEPEQTAAWTVDLGRYHTTTLKVNRTPPSAARGVTRYEIDTVHVARRDGIFLQSDITIEREHAGSDAIRLQVPRPLSIQSVSVAGAQLSYERPADQPERLWVSLPGEAQQRVTFRVLGFQPMRWGQKRVLPKVQVDDAEETKRTMTLRIETPLRVNEIEPQGLLQTGLSQDSTGEIWRFESRQLGSRLFVNVGFPTTETIADMVCLADYRRRAAWIATRLNLRAEEGANYDSVIQLPEDWDLVTVTAADSESRIAAWNVRDQVLTISYQSPMTSTSRRSVHLFARCPGIRPETSGTLVLPSIRDASEVNVRFQVLAPGNHAMEVLEGEGWQPYDQVEIDPVFREWSHLRSLLEAGGAHNLYGLRSRSGQAPSQTVIQFVERRPLEQSFPLPTLDESALSSGLLSDTVKASGGNGTSAMHWGTACLLRLSTKAGYSANRQLVHRAELVFNGPVTASELHLRLPESCRLSSVSADGEGITVFRDEETIRFPAETSQFTRLSLIYITDGEATFLTQDNLVPVPYSALPVTEFEWRLSLPPEFRLSGMSLPGGIGSMEYVSGGVRRPFGPLTRTERDRFFQPFSPAAWRNLLGGARDPVTVDQAGRETFIVFAPGVGEAVRFSTWDRIEARNAGWIALLSCLLIGIGSRLFNLKVLRRLTLAWTVLLAGVALLVPPAWSMIVGGMLAGTLVSGLLPRRLIQMRDFLFFRQAQKTSLRTAATGLLILGLFSFWGGASSRSDETGPPEELPVVLIRSAEYFWDAPEQAMELPLPRGIAPPWRSELDLPQAGTRFHPPSIRAVYDVLVQRQDRETLIRLPFRNVVFQSGAECLVDGVARPLIPSLSGEAVVIRIEPRPESEGHETETGVVWDRHRIEMDLTMRRLRSDGEPTGVRPRLARDQTWRMDARVPAVLDSRMVRQSNGPGELLDRWGAALRTDESASRVWLGAVGRLATVAVRSLNDVEHLSAVTLLEASPLRVRGQTRISTTDREAVEESREDSEAVPERKGRPERLPERFSLHLPAEAVVTAVSGAGVRDWFQSADETRRRVSVRMNPGEAGSSLLISFEIGEVEYADDLLRLPSFPLTAGRPIPHSIGLTIPVGMTATLADLGGTHAISSEEWSSQGDFGRTRPVLAVRLDEPRPFAVNLVSSRPQTTAGISETLTVHRDHLSWEAVVRTSVSQVPTFQHKFRIDSGLKLESVTSGREGADGPVRFVHDSDGGMVTMFVPGGQLGDRTFTLSGTKGFVPDVWRSIPTLSIVEGTESDSQLTVRDETFWNVELQTTSGTTVRSFKADSEASDTSEDDRTVGIFSRRTVGRPAMIRALPPPESTRVDSVILLRTPDEEPWELVTMLHFSATEIRLRKATFSIPGEYESHRILPSQYRHSAIEENGRTVVTSHIPERFSDSATITVVTPIPPEVQAQLEQEESAASWKLPLIEVTSAQMVTQFVLTDPQGPVMPSPASTMKVSGVALPNWTPAEWHNLVRMGERICSQQVRPQLELVRKTAVTGAEPVRITMDETILWPLEDGSVRGLTHLWLLNHAASQFRITHGSDVTVQLVSSEANRSLEFVNEAGACTVRIENPEPLMPLQLQWSALPGRPSPLRLLDYPVPAEHRLVAVVAPQSTRLHTGEATPLSRLEACLYRWEALLENLVGSIGTLPVDGALLNNIRTCQQQASQLLKEPGVTDEHRQRHRALEERWNQRQLELGVIDDPSPSQVPFGAVSMARLLAAERNLEAVSWLVPEAPGWQGESHPRRGGRRIWGLIGGGFLLLGLLAAAVRYVDRLTDVRETLASHPGWSLILLGSFWWLILSPSVVGLLLLLAGFGNELACRSRRRASLGPAQGRAP